MYTLLYLIPNYVRYGANVGYECDKYYMLFVIVSSLELARKFGLAVQMPSPNALKYRFGAR